MSLAQGNNTPTRSRIEPGSLDSESDALTTRPVRSPFLFVLPVQLDRVQKCTYAVNGDKFPLPEGVRS